MFIRTTRNRIGQAYHHLVESYRSCGKVKQRTLLSLGRVEDGKLEQLAQAIAKHTDLLSALDVAKTIGVETTYVLGPLLILRGLFAQLGIDAALERLERDHPKLKFSLREVVFALVAERFVRPTSKVAVSEPMLERLYPDMLHPADLDLQHVHRALEILDRGKDGLETSLSMHGPDRFSSPVDVVLYDLTTLRFERTSATEKLRPLEFTKNTRDCGASKMPSENSREH